MSERRELGVLVEGSLTRNLVVRLDPRQSAQLGQYVMAPIEGEGQLLGMVTDVLLRSAESGATSWPPPADDDAGSALLRDILLDTAVYTALEVTPYLEVTPGAEPTRVRRLPRHFARVSAADQDALDAAFETGEKPAVCIGNPLGMDELELYLDIEKLFERSAGIFGKSGTGKTVLTLQLLDALIANSARAASNRDKTVALVFDMHNDYGWSTKFQGDGGQRRSLKQQHGNDVVLYSLARNADNVDGTILIGTKDIKPLDLDVVQSVTSMTEAALEAASVCEERLGDDWFDDVLESTPSARTFAKLSQGGDAEDSTWTRIAALLAIHPSSFDNLRRGLRRIARLDFVQSGAGQFSQTLEAIVKTLQNGKSVVIQFGHHGNDLTSYLLVANMLSRRIWGEYQRKKEAAQGDEGREPNRLVIVIEEAHRFIDKSMAGQTIFGNIARELRKYNVTLLVIDQRPSQIDAEVLSQVGTKFVLQLDAEADVEAVVGGVAERSALRRVITSLESKQQALVFGHAVPIPVVVRPRDMTRDQGPGASLRTRLGVNGGNGMPVTGKLFGTRP